MDILFSFDTAYVQWLVGPSGNKETNAVTASSEELQNQDFVVAQDVGSGEIFELWNQLGIQYDLLSLIKGETTPAQFQETYKQQVQDALDLFFKK